MRVKPELAFLAVLPILLCAAAELKADTIFLKNGRSIKGIIVREEKDSVYLDVGFGAVTFQNKDIKQIYRSTARESSQIRKKWEQDTDMKKEKKSQRERRPQEITIDKFKDHIIVEALLNDKVNAKLLLDTGASYTVLFSNIADKLALDIAKEKNGVRLQLADGSNIIAKLITLKSIKVQDTEAKDVEVAIMPGNVDSAGINDGVLGMSFLKLFTFKVDYSKGKLVLEKL